jgi:hypothetical protein
MNNIVNFRNTWTSFYKNICLLDSNNNIINNKFVLFFLNNISYYFLINSFILKQLKINYLYKMDSLYFYENYLPKNNFIFPIIYNFKLDDVELIDRIKLYDFNVPIKIFFLNENININKYNNIYLKTLKFNKVFTVDNVLTFKISDLFN